jgi:hypothetical protein
VTRLCSEKGHLCRYGSMVERSWPRTKVEEKSCVGCRHVAWDPACCELRVGFLLGLLFNPEDGDMFLRNIGFLLTDTMALYLRRYCSPDPKL